MNRSCMARGTTNHAHVHVTVDRKPPVFRMLTRPRKRAHSQHSPGPSSYGVELPGGILASSRQRSLVARPRRHPAPSEAPATRFTPCESRPGCQWRSTVLPLVSSQRRQSHTPPTRTCHEHPITWRPGSLAANHSPPLDLLPGFCAQMGEATTARPAPPAHAQNRHQAVAACRWLQRAISRRLPSCRVSALSV